MDTYLVITTVDIEQQMVDGSVVLIPAGSVVNTVLWDGVTEWTPGENLIAQLVS